MENRNNNKQSPENRQGSQDSRFSEKREERPSGIRGGGTDLDDFKGENNEISSAGEVATLNDNFNEQPIQTPETAPFKEIEDHADIGDEQSISEESYDPENWPAGDLNEEGGFGDERSSEEAGNGSSVGNP